MGATLSTPLAGANTDRRTQTAEFTIGMSALDNQNRTWVYCVADLAVPANTTANVLSGTFHITATSTGAYTNDAAFAQNDYGWVRKTTSPL